MKYPRLVSMPSAVSDWLEEQLEARGIDSLIYTRYILSLLHTDAVDVISSEEDLFFPHLNQEVRLSSAGGRKKNRRSSEWRHSDYNVDELKRLAAVKCLMSASEESHGIESLVDELFEKVKEIKCEVNNTPGIENNSLLIRKMDENFSEEEIANRYGRAFPPLNRNRSNFNNQQTTIPNFIPSSISQIMPPLTSPPTSVSSLTSVSSSTSTLSSTSSSISTSSTTSTPTTASTPTASSPNSNEIATMENEHFMPNKNNKKGSNNEANNNKLIEMTIVPTDRHELKDLNSKENIVGAKSLMKIVNINIDKSNNNNEMKVNENENLLYKNLVARVVNNGLEEDIITSDDITFDDYDYSHGNEFNENNNRNKDDDDDTGHDGDDESSSDRDSDDDHDVHDQNQNNSNINRYRRSPIGNRRRYGVSRNNSIHNYSFVFSKSIQDFDYANHDVLDYMFKIRLPQMNEKDIREAIRDIVRTYINSDIYANRTDLVNAVNKVDAYLKQAERKIKHVKRRIKKIDYTKEDLLYKSNLTHFRPIHKLDEIDNFNMISSNDSSYNDLSYLVNNDYNEKLNDELIRSEGGGLENDERTPSDIECDEEVSQIFYNSNNDENEFEMENNIDTNTVMRTDISSSDLASKEEKDDNEIKNVPVCIWCEEEKLRKSPNLWSSVDDTEQNVQNLPNVNTELLHNEIKQDGIELLNALNNFLNENIIQQTRFDHVSNTPIANTHFFDIDEIENYQLNSATTFITTSTTSTSTTTTTTTTATTTSATTTTNTTFATTTITSDTTTITTTITSTSANTTTISEDENLGNNEEFSFALRIDEIDMQMSPVIPTLRSVNL